MQLETATQLRPAIPTVTQPSTFDRSRRRQSRCTCASLRPSARAGALVQRLGTGCRPRACSAPCGCPQRRMVPCRRLSAQRLAERADGGAEETVDAHQPRELVAGATEVEPAARRRRRPGSGPRPGARNGGPVRSGHQRSRRSPRPPTALPRSGSPGARCACVARACLLAPGSRSSRADAVREPPHRGAHRVQRRQAGAVPQRGAQAGLGVIKIDVSASCGKKPQDGSSCTRCCASFGPHRRPAGAAAGAQRQHQPHRPADGSRADHRRRAVRPAGHLRRPGQPPRDCRDPDRRQSRHGRARHHQPGRLQDFHAGVQ